VAYLPDAVSIRAIRDNVSQGFLGEGGDFEVKYLTFLEIAARGTDATVA